MGGADADTSDGIDCHVFCHGAGKQYSFFLLTLDHYVKFFTDPDFLLILWRSLVIAVKTTVICLILGYPAAYFIARSREKLQNILILCITIPMWINMLVRTYAWIGLLSEGGMIQRILGFFGLGNVELLYTGGLEYFLVWCTISLPFMILQIRRLLARWILPCWRQVRIWSESGTASPGRTHGACRQCSPLPAAEFLLASFHISESNASAFSAGSH